MAKMTKKFQAYLTARKISPGAPMAPLAGIEELRKVVAWANGQPESEHDYMTPEELIARYREETGPQCPMCFKPWKQAQYSGHPEHGAWCAHCDSFVRFSQILR
jgi:hypothetical protein